MERISNDMYGEMIFEEFTRIIPQHNFKLVDVFVGGLDDDRVLTSFRIKCDGKLIKTLWPKMGKKDWLSTYSGIEMWAEMVRFIYEQIMVELGYWRLNDPDKADYFPEDPDRFFVFVDNKTNRPPTYPNFSFKLPEV